MVDEFGAAPRPGDDARRPAGYRPATGPTGPAAEAGGPLAAAAAEVIAPAVSGALEAIPSILSAAAGAIPSIAGAIVEGLADGLSR